MTRLVAFLVLSVAACAGNDPAATPSQPGHLAKLAYDAPLEWSQATAQTPRGESATWMPVENVRKESLIVRRIALQPNRPPPTVESVRELVTAAQRQLPHAEISGAEAFVTPAGLRGVRVETDFRPAGSPVKYHRVHAVLLDGDHYVHVLYTAQQPDWSHRMFDLIVNSLHEEV